MTQPLLSRPVPVSIPPDVTPSQTIETAEAGITAGFPSPAQDYSDEPIDLNREVVRHPESTFYARVRGDSMVGAGVADGDLVVVDRSMEPRDGDLVVACVDGEFTLKRFRDDRRRGCAWLVPANPRFKPLRIEPGDPFAIWGVVTHSIKKFR